VSMSVWLVAIISNICCLCSTMPHWSYVAGASKTLLFIVSFSTAPMCCCPPDSPMCFFPCRLWSGRDVLWLTVAEDWSFYLCSWCTFGLYQ
jgi:hypothetical protein